MMPMPSRARVLAVTGLMALGAAACDGGAPAQPLFYQVVRTLPHDSTAYTQGLLLHDGVLYE